ncbi:AIR synthase related protein [Haloarculaceae archaeon H-GB2-1]|nr:AIR synthase related protein [Haloarculaceae archaeon H-GB11]MEA5409022.1 AIR synthase related protein [Haloarculaceae archaeon H-GB2-1]
MVGKVPPADLRDVVFERLGAESDAVVQGPAYGEDAAALSLGDQLLVVSTDPISLAAAHVGTLGVHVACNDVAASGATLSGSPWSSSSPTTSRNCSTP